MLQAVQSMYARMYAVSRAMLSPSIVDIHNATTMGQPSLVAQGVALGMQNRKDTAQNRLETNAVCTNHNGIHQLPLLLTVPSTTNRTLLQAPYLPHQHPGIHPLSLVTVKKSISTTAACLKAPCCHPLFVPGVGYTIKAPHQRCQRRPP